MTEVFSKMPNKDAASADDDSPDRCRERRRRRIQMRRLSNGPALAAAANSLKEEGSAAAADPSRGTNSRGKRPHPAEGGSLTLTPSSSSPPSSSSSPPSPGDEEADPTPPPPAPREEVPEYGTMSVTGRSREMEDAVDVRAPLCRPEITGGLPVHFFGVFDGHGGAHVAALLSVKMHAFLAEELTRLLLAEEDQGPCDGGSSAKRPREEGRVRERRAEDLWRAKWREAVKRAFQRVDDIAVTTCPCGSIGCRCSCQPMEVALGGSTAVAALLAPGHIVVGNCGDSRAVLCRAGRPIPLTRDHKPDRADERARIQALGGRIILLNGARVEGILAMSRAIGDKYLKPYVTAEPETTIIRRDPRDEFLIIASDGLWDVLTNELACSVVARCLHESIDLNSSGPRSAGAEGQSLYSSKSALAAALLTRLALGRKSQDNISVIVVDLKRS